MSCFEKVDLLLTLIPSFTKDSSMTSTRSTYVVSAQKQNNFMIKNIKTTAAFKIMLLPTWVLER